MPSKTQHFPAKYIRLIKVYVNGVEIGVSDVILPCWLCIQNWFYRVNSKSPIVWMTRCSVGNGVDSPLKRINYSAQHSDRKLRIRRPSLYHSSRFSFIYWRCHFTYALWSQIRRWRTRLMRVFPAVGSRAQLKKRVENMEFSLKKTHFYRGDKGV